MTDFIASLWLILQPHLAELIALAIAARAFQRSAGLAADGIIGPMTWAALIPEH